MMRILLRWQGRILSCQCRRSRMLILVDIGLRVTVSSGQDARGRQVVGTGDQLCRRHSLAKLALSVCLELLVP